MVAPAFVVFSLFTFPAVPLALAIKTPRKDDDMDSSKEQDDSAAAANATASNAMRYTVMVMCAAILFLGVGAEIGYGTWIATYSLDKLGVSEVAAAYLSSSYYGGFLFGRLVAVPLSTQLSPLQLLYISYVGGTLALLPLVPGVLEAVGIELQQTQTQLEGASDVGSAGLISPVELSVGVSIGLGVFIAPIFAACMSVSTVAGLPMTSAMMSFQVSGAVLGEMLVTVAIGARISEDVDEFATLNLAVMASGLMLCLLLSAVLARLPASVDAPGTASIHSGKKQEEDAAAEREALIG
eukprot:COSAG02_NODE_639_length_19078_cov_9.380262_9_plen_296_part_00